MGNPANCTRKMAVKIFDNTGAVVKATQRAMWIALEECGQQAETEAKRNFTASGRSGGTGALRNSISHRVVDYATCYVGTNLNYAPYHELGTGTYAEGGTGRKGWWVYVAGSGSTRSRRTGKVYTKQQAMGIAMALRKQGLDARITNGIKPLHFLRNSVQDHITTYKQIIAKNLKANVK